MYISLGMNLWRRRSLTIKNGIKAKEGRWKQYSFWVAQDCPRTWEATFSDLGHSISAKSLNNYWETVSFLKHQNCRWLCSQKAVRVSNATSCSVCASKCFTKAVLAARSLHLRGCEAQWIKLHHGTPPTSCPEFHLGVESGSLYCDLGMFSAPSFVFKWAFISW